VLDHIFHQLHQHSKQVSYSDIELTKLMIFLKFKLNVALFLSNTVYRVFISLCSGSNNCMTTLSSSFDPTALNQYTSLPSQVYDADTMCKHILGSGSSFCQVILGHYDDLKWPSLFSSDSKIQIYNNALQISTNFTLLRNLPPTSVSDCKIRCWIKHLFSVTV
jgi:hypothetical protein